MEHETQPTHRHLWAGNWTLDEDIDGFSIFKLRFNDNGQGSLSIKNDNKGYLCTTFYSAFSRTNDSTKFEFTFARGRIRGEFVIDRSRKMYLTVTNSTLSQLPVEETSLQWQLVRC